ncbi:porin [Vibrio sp. LaRot3]|uniref:porin n=1 Tax=Vibrio sp. LaRot3 TaxID=2998829 RepID=UPI0022CDC8F6|nr:porin [Vibrio sp. LaRot3]MDA0146912.1 porin [Vibrio sp. LaRot3]
MDKFFKRTLVGAAVAAAAVAGSANAAVQVVGDAVQFYGQAAGALIYSSNQDSTNTVIADIESRIGFRGVVEFEDLEPNFIWQMEGGNANNGTNSGGLGVRDTYLGFDWEGFGSIKYGRQLVAAYNIVDGHTNPGTGNVFDDWHGSAGGDLDADWQGRADHVIRYDSANFGGFTFSGTLSGMEADTSALVASATAAYQNDRFLAHAGFYNQGEHGEGATLEYDRSYFVLGGYLFLGDFTLNAAYRDATIDTANSGENGQESYSMAVQYTIDDHWFVKAGYAHKTTTTVADAAGQDDSDTAVTGRVAYLLPSSILYFDVRDYDFDGDDNSEDGTNFVFGAEYYF